jgi:hypothetical protein
MSFMQPQVEFGEWHAVEGPAGNEWVPADLVGDLDEQFNPYVSGQGYVNPALPIPAALRDYCENRQAWVIARVKGWGARLTAPDYMDCTAWVVFDSEQEAREYLAETYGDDDESEDE